MGMMRLTEGMIVLSMTMLLFLRAPDILHAAKDYSEINADITGITAKMVEFETDDALEPGQELIIRRGDKVIAELKVVKIKGNIVSAIPVKTFEEIDFDDKVVKVTELQPPEEEKPKETPTAVTPAETKPEELQKETIATEPKTEEKKEETTSQETPKVVTPEEKPLETKTEGQETVATLPETPPSATSEEAAAKPQTFGVSFGYSLFVPKSFKVSNSGFKGEARVKIPAVKNLYGALSYAQHRWTDKTTELKLNVLSVSLAYSLKPFVPQTFSFINDVQVMAGYSNLSSRLSQDTTTLTKSTSGFNTGIALQLLKFLSIDYRFHSFTLDFPNGKIKNGEQVTASFSYAF